MKSIIGRPREWNEDCLGSVRVPKTTVPPVRAVAHAIDDGIVTEAQVVEWLQEMKTSKCTAEKLS